MACLVDRAGPLMWIEPSQRRWLPIALFGLLALSAAPLHQARAGGADRRRGEPGWLARGVGHRLTVDRHASRRQRARHRYDQRTTYHTEVSFSAAELTAQIEGLRQDPRVRVELIDDGKKSETYWRTGKGYPVYRIRVPAEGGAADRRRRGKGKARAAAGDPLRVVVAAGVHGDETVGPVTAMKLVDRALKHSSFRRRFDLSVAIKVDPFGARTTPEGRDLNRHFGAGRWTSTTRAMHRAAGDLASCDLFVDLHSAGLGREGFFLIRGVDDGRLSRRILSAMQTRALWDAQPANPTDGPYRFHTLGGVRTATAGTFKGYVAAQGVPLSYTLEAPRTLAPARQVSGMLKLLRSTLDNVARYGRRAIRESAKATNPSARRGSR